DSIASFKIDDKTGELAFIEHTPTQGKTPRNFEIEPNGRFLLAANQNADNIVVFAIDEKTGVLSPTGFSAPAPSPVCLKLIPGFSA
ncbi:MAG: lactonase family protein, partial [Pyrinomonadaceae bacterium]